MTARNLNVTPLNKVDHDVDLRAHVNALADRARSICALLADDAREDGYLTAQGRFELADVAHDAVLGIQCLMSGDSSR